MSEIGLEGLVPPSCREEEFKQRQVERERRHAIWAGKTRSCPRCGTEFVSVQDRGACPSCRHVFYAGDAECSDEDGA